MKTSRFALLAMLLLAVSALAEPQGATKVGQTAGAPSPALAGVPGGEAFTRLRMAFAGAADFNPYWSVDEERTVLLEAVAARDVKRVLALSERWLARVPVDAEMHLIRAQLLKQEGDLAGALHHFECFYGLLHSIAASGDGRSAKTAYQVIAVAEEYYLLREMDAEVIQQSLQDGCDCLVVKLKDGSQTELFFDVSISLGATRKMIQEGR